MTETPRTLADLPAPDDATARRLLALLGGGEPKVRAELPLPSTSPKRERCCLYRHYDADGTLLYVGISGKPSRRTGQHAKSSAWLRFAKSQEGVWFDDRAEAERAERDAIQSEAPIFNRVHADIDRDKRAAAYLIENEAWDLLRAGI